MADKPTTAAEVPTAETEEVSTATTAETAPATATTPAPTPAAAKKRKTKRAVAYGHVHILASFNNTIITITDSNGGALSASSAGACGFRGSKKGTAYAAQVAAEKAIITAKQLHGLNKADVFVKGIGLGREAAIRSLSANDIGVEAIHDVTGVPHGGVRPRKARRV